MAESLSKEREQYLADSERLRENAQELERELSEIQATYERDSALWNNKFSF